MAPFPLPSCRPLLEEEPAAIIGELDSSSRQGLGVSAFELLTVDQQWAELDTLTASAPPTTSARAIQQRIRNDITQPGAVT